MAEYKPYSIPDNQPGDSTYEQIDSYMSNFKGGNRIQRGGGWALKGGGSNTATFVGTGSVSQNFIPSTNNTYTLGTSSFKWSDVETVKINNATPLAGTKVYYVSDTSGGAVNRKLTFVGGILTAET